AREARSMSASELWLVAPRSEIGAQADRWLARWLGDMLGIRVALIFADDPRSARTPAGARVACAGDDGFVRAAPDGVLRLPRATVALLGLAYERLWQGRPGADLVPELDAGVTEMSRRIDGHWPEG